MTYSSLYRCERLFNSLGAGWPVLCMSVSSVIHCYCYSTLCVAVVIVHCFSCYLGRYPTAIFDAGVIGSAALSITEPS